MSQLPTPALSQGVANTGPTPRVNGRYMAHKYGKRVRLQVKIIKNDVRPLPSLLLLPFFIHAQQHGGYTFEATDGVPVEIICNGVSPGYPHSMRRHLCMLTQYPVGS